MKIVYLMPNGLELEVRMDSLSVNATVVELIKLGDDIGAKSLRFVF